MAGIKLNEISTESGLTIKGLRKSYKKRTVIHDVSMQLHRGEVVALLGPNGSGKTTTFYSIAGLVNPDGGQVKVDGIDVSTLPMYRRARLGIGYLPQEVSIFRGLNVEDNISAILDVSEPDRHTRRERLEELLGEFSIEHLRRTSAVALSGGERRRVEIARALAAKPKYLLLDEPFAALDVLTIKMLKELIVNLQSQENISICICDHQARDLLSCVDSAIILSNCKIIAQGTPTELVNDNKAKNAYFGDSFKFN